MNMATQSSHHDAAAYSASQPLYEALRNAAARVDQQRAKLRAAMKEVQSIHIKLQQDQLHTKPLIEEDYARRILDAWHDTTTSFEQVFRELKAVTVANPAEGREAKPAHKKIARLHETARQAQAQARTLLAESTGAAPSPGDKPRTLKRAAISDVDLVRSYKLAKIDGGQVDEAVADKSATAQEASTGEPERNSQRTTWIDGVEHEDVQAEVEARIKLREQKRKETKGEMKRKRRSRESFEQITLRSRAVLESGSPHKRARHDN